MFEIHKLLELVGIHIPDVLPTEPGQEGAIQGSESPHFHEAFYKLQTLVNGGNTSSGARQDPIEAVIIDKLKSALDKTDTEFSHQHEARILISFLLADTPSRLDFLKKLNKHYKEHPAVYARTDLTWVESIRGQLLGRVNKAIESLPKAGDGFHPDFPLLSSLYHFTTLLTELDIPHVIIGGVAISILSGRELISDDLDFIIAPTSDQYEKLLAQLRGSTYQGFQVTTDRSSGETKPFMVRAKFHGNIIDLLIALNEYDDSLVARTKYYNFAGRAIPVASPEDIIVHKTIIGRSKDKRDIKVLLEAFTDLDWDYIKKWLAHFEATDELETMLRVDPTQAPVDPTPPQHDAIMATFDRSLDHENVFDPTFKKYFGENVSVSDLTTILEQETAIKIDRISIGEEKDNHFYLKIDFHNGIPDSTGFYECYFKRKSNGRLVKTRFAELKMEGMGIRAALQFQANMVRFSRQTGIIDEYWINAHDIGRYVYRFFDGIKLDKESIDKLKQSFADLQSILPLSTSQWAQLPQLKTPREWSDFIVLDNLSKQWIEWVSQMIDQKGYRFTVDQVVDIARRPGLALLLSQDAYAMSLDIKDDAAFTRFNSSIGLARENKTLPRARGVLGQSFNYLPAAVRNALILFRPYLFPKPGPSAEIPDLSTLTIPKPAFGIKAFKTLDGAEVASIPADPEGLHVRDFRKEEARAVTQAIADGNKAVLVTGLSGSGITEGLIWNLEKDLTAQGHRVVSIDIKKVADFIREHKDPDELEKIIRVMDESLQANVIIIDNALLIDRLPNKQLIQILLKKYFSRPDQHIVLLGSGRNSFASQEKTLKSILDPLGIKDPPVVAVHPKPLNLTQAYRFLGLAKINWLSFDEKLSYLKEVFAKIPTYYPFMENLRLSFGPQKTFEETINLVADDMTPDYWENAMGAVVEEINVQPQMDPEPLLTGAAIATITTLPALGAAMIKP